MHAKNKSKIDLEILGRRVERYITRKALKNQQRDVPGCVCVCVCNMFGTIQTFITNCNLRQGWETLTTGHQILKLMDVLTCMKGRRGSVRLYTSIIACEGRKMPGKCFYFRAAAHGLNCCRTELILHRICVNGGNTTCHCEMSGPLSHTAPDSIVYCLGPGVEPPTYKSKVWARS